MSVNWVTSDLHFNHKNVIKYCDRPYDSVEEMNERIIETWNNQVSDDDTVYHLGDFAFANYTKVREYLSQLKGNKIFLIGNHDRVLRKNKESLEEEFDMKFYDYYELVVDKTFIVMCHYPFTRWNRASYGSLNLHGHCHGGNAIQLENQIDVGWDSPEMYDRPAHCLIDLREILVKFGKV